VRVRNIPKHLQDRTGRKNIDQLSRNLNLLTPMAPINIALGPRYDQAKDQTTAGARAIDR
jgi:hypothetical protein